MDQGDYIFKIIIIGDSGSGKSSFIYHFLNAEEKKNPQYTIGVEYSSKIIRIDNKKVKLQIWDTAGQERFKSITKAYYRGAHGVFVMYDMTNQDSFKNVDTWVNDAREFADQDISIMVLGNKCDLKNKRKIYYDDGLVICQSKGVAFCECSSTEGQNVDLSFAELCRMIEQRVQSGSLPLENICPRRINDGDADEDVR